MILTLSGVSQLSTHHSSISTIPGVKTHSTPLIVHADLHSAFIWNVTSCQSQLTSCTWSYRHKQRNISICYMVTSTKGIECCTSFVFTLHSTTLRFQRALYTVPNISTLPYLIMQKICIRDFGSIKLLEISFQ